MGSMAHSEALEWPGPWDSVDVVFVDATDEMANTDNFPGVEVAAHVRTQQRTSRATVVVVTGHFFNPGLRWRMKEAGADLFFHRSQLRTPDRLRQALLHPEQFSDRNAVPPVRDAVVRRLGIGRSTSVNTFVRLVRDSGLGPTFERKGSPPVPRRQWMAYRRWLGDRARIKVVNMAEGTTPSHQDRRSPSTPQLRKLFTWAARVPRP